MTFHLYTLINIILIGYLGQEVKLYSKGIKRKRRLIIFSIFSFLSFVGVILFDILSLKNIATLVYDIVLSVFIFFLLYTRNVDNYKVMQKVYKKKQVKKLNIIFNIVMIFLLLFPFIFFAILSLIQGKTDFYFPNKSIPYLILGMFVYLAITFIVIFVFTLKFYKHYKSEVESKKLTKVSDEISNESKSAE